jgi:hypothetical protein
MNLEGETFVPHGKDRTAADLVQQINAKNAKLLAFCMVLGFISYHGILHLQYGHSIQSNAKKLTRLNRRSAPQASTRASGCYRMAATKATRSGNPTAA